jgi:cytochrome c
MIRRKEILYILIALSLVSCSNGDDEVNNTNQGYVDNKTVSTAVHTNQEQQASWPESFGIGRKATRKEIRAWDIDVRPDGKGLPAGYGRVANGRIIYEKQCASCHGKEGTGATYSRLVGIMDDTTKVKTIGNYWPYSTTLFDYIRRAMPYNKPGSLSDTEVYGLTAYLLYLNKIIDSTTTIDNHTLPKVQMPAQPYFVNDDRRGGHEVR